MEARRTTAHAPDYVLLATVVALCVFGLIMVFSSSMAVAGSEQLPPSYFLTRQALFLLIGAVVMSFFLGVDYRRWRPFAPLLFAGAVGLLIAVLIFGVRSYTGAKSWLISTSVQPSEMAKLAVIIFIADWLPRKGEDVRNLGYGLVPFGLLLGFVVGLIMAQPDLGTAMVILLTAGAVFMIAGADTLQFVGATGLASLALFLVVRQVPHQMARLTYFWDPFSQKTDAAAHVQQALIALGSGGWTGLGLGSSREKWGDLPLAYSDSIFAIVGEELGIVATVAVVALFAVLGYRGLRIALETGDPFGRLLATGITLWMLIQAAVHMGGNTALLPFTGIPLPLMSYGGSSLVMSLAGLGILLSISRHTQRVSAPASSLQRMRHASNGLGGRNRGARVSGTGRSG